MISPPSSLSADSDDAPSPPLLQRLQHEHKLDMQRLRSEKAERELQAERKATDRALRREERTSHALRAECASLAQQLQALQAHHAGLTQQAELVPRLKQLVAQRKAERARAEQRATEYAQQLASERSRADAQERSLQVAERELEAARRAALKVEQLQERQAHEERERGRTEEEARHGAELLQQREAEVRTAEAAMWRERAEAAQEAAMADDEQRGRFLGAIRSRRRAAQWYILHWTRLLLLERTAVRAREAELGRLAALGAALRSGTRANTARQLAGRCLLHWAQRARAHSRCAARWHALRTRAEVAAVALGADGWRTKPDRRSGERERQKRSLWRKQHVVFNTQTMRRMVFSLWRMWADGSLLHEWARTTEARWGAVHFAEREWWRAGE